MVASRLVFDWITRDHSLAKLTHTTDQHRAQRSSRNKGEATLKGPKTNLEVGVAGAQGMLPLGVTLGRIVPTNLDLMSFLLKVTILEFIGYLQFNSKNHRRLLHSPLFRRYIPLSLCPCWTWGPNSSDIFTHLPSYPTIHTK